MAVIFVALKWELISLCLSTGDVGKQVIGINRTDSVFPMQAEHLKMFPSM